jgi:hypothetical protein
VIRWQHEQVQVGIEEGVAHGRIERRRFDQAAPQEVAGVAWCVVRQHRPAQHRGMAVGADQQLADVQRALHIAHRPGPGGLHHTLGAHTVPHRRVHAGAQGRMQLLPGGHRVVHGLALRDHRRRARASMMQRAPAQPQPRHRGCGGRAQRGLQQHVVQTQAGAAVHRLTGRPLEDLESDAQPLQCQPRGQARNRRADDDGLHAGLAKFSR